MSSSNPVFGVSDFVAVFNQTLEFAYQAVEIVGEIKNLRVSKNRWVYFDLKDEFSSVKCFATVYQLPGPVEDGMLIEIRATPKLHQTYGLSLNLLGILRPVGEGALKKAANLLEAKLREEGLFDDSRKRAIAQPPNTIGLIASTESAAYQDFIKILNERWSGVKVYVYDVQVQGEPAITEVESAIEYFNNQSDAVDVLVITRGGGSPDDLAAFSTEQVTRAVAASHIPTVVAIGHEIDVSLAELAADCRASTPSNAAQLLVPDKSFVVADLQSERVALTRMYVERLQRSREALIANKDELNRKLLSVIDYHKQLLVSRREVLEALNPHNILERGFAIVRSAGKIVSSVTSTRTGDTISIEFSDGKKSATIQ